MIAHANTPDSPTQMPPMNRRSLRRAIPLMVLPVVLYGLIRPHVSSDALALGIAGGVPLLYSLGVAIVCRTIDYVALVSAVGFSVACVVSFLVGGGSLPLKLHEAMITFAVGLVLLVAVLVRRPFPVGQLLRVPCATKHTNSALGAMIGGFLVLHALLHVTLAVSLSTSSYLIAARLVDWGTLAIGIIGLWAYVRRLRGVE
jgi:hypothetical protein